MEKKKKYIKSTPLTYFIRITIFQHNQLDSYRLSILLRDSEFP